MKRLAPLALAVQMAALSAVSPAADYGTLSPSAALVRAPYAVCTGYSYDTNVTERIDREGETVTTNLVITVTTNGIYTETATLPELTANALGYKLVTDTPPVTDTNHYAVATGWAETNRIVRLYEVRELPPPPPRRWTPLSIKRAAVSLGYWPQLKAFMQAADAYDDFCMAQYEAEDDPQFVALMSAARAQFGDAAVDAILNTAEVEP